MPDLGSPGGTDVPQGAGTMSVLHGSGGAERAPCQTRGIPHGTDSLSSDPTSTVF